MNEVEILCNNNGPLKVTGSAGYAGGIRIAGMVYAVPVLSTIAHGNIVAMDTQAAGKAPGVLSVITRENAPPLHNGGNDSGTTNPALGIGMPDLLQWGLRAIYRF